MGKVFEIEDVDIYKKASLVLYGLGASDRQWVLDNLPKAQSERLGALIAELTDIGVSPYDNALKDILQTSDLSDASRHDDSLEYAEMVKRIDHFSVESIEDILSDEPAEMVAMVLSVKNWPWSAKYLATLSAETRDSIRKLLKVYVGTIAEPVKNGIVSYLDQQYTAGQGA